MRCQALVGVTQNGGKPEVSGVRGVKIYIWYKMHKIVHTFNLCK